MLSFQRENSSEEPLADKPGGSNQDGEYYTVATREKQVRKSTTLLAILFVIGLVCLGYMIKRTTPKAASASETNTEETEIQSAMARLTGVKSEIFNKMGEIVNKFYEFSGVKQVKVDELAKNPFEFKLFLTDIQPDGDTGQTIPDVDVETLKRRQMAKQAKELKVLSIMESNRGNCCMISDKFLYEGDMIEGFRIMEIREDRVKLLWTPRRDQAAATTQLEDLEIVLKLSE